MRNSSIKRSIIKISFLTLVLIIMVIVSFGQWPKPTISPMMVQGAKPTATPAIVYPYPAPENSANTITEATSEGLAPGRSDIAYPAPATLDSQPMTVFAYPAPGATPQGDVNYIKKLYLPVVTSGPATYNRLAAAQYADNWTHGRNLMFPDYGNEGGPPYLPCNDCTNFVSQALWYGGMPLIPGDWDRESTNERYWWTKFCPSGGCDTNPTWRLTDMLFSHVSYYWNWDVNSRKYQVLYGVSLDDLSSYLEQGDFILMKDPFIQESESYYTHARFIVGMGYIDRMDLEPGDEAEEGRYALLADQHCTDRYHVAYDYLLHRTNNGIPYDVIGIHVLADNIQ